MSTSDDPPTEPLPATVATPPHLGPYEQQSAALAAGNIGIVNGHWYDYDTQGGPGEWFVVPTTTEG